MSHQILTFTKDIIMFRLATPHACIKMRFMRTTIDINDAILDALKQRAKTEGRPMTKVVNDTLERGLSTGPKPKKKVRIKTHAVGIRAAYRGMSMNQLYDQIESDHHLKVAEE